MSNVSTIVLVTASLAVLGGIALAKQDKYTLKVPGDSHSLSSGDTKVGQ